MEAQVDLKGAIIKYLRDEWNESEKEKLKKIRYEFASEMVPIALGSSSTPTTLGSIEEYIDVLTNDPDSDKGKAAISYLSELLKGNIYDRHKINKIVDLAKLYCLKDEFFDDSAEIEYGDLKYGKDYVKFSDGIVEIKKNLSREELFDLVSGENKLYASPSFFHISSISITDIGELTLDYPSKSEAEIIEMLKGTIKELEMKRVDKALKNLTLKYRVEFDEGKATSEELELTKYSPRIESILDKILTEPS
jgi:hypothetical protein